MERRSRRRTETFTIAALGVVFGDIGTSPLYAFRACFSGEEGVAVSPENVLGVLSLLVWSLVLIVAGKYASLVLRADNRGEGGVLALMGITLQHVSFSARLVQIMTYVGLIGAALFFGDAIITPAISVLSAVEGIEIAIPGLSHWVVPISVAVLIALFAIQSRGTAKVGRAFGPIMLLWFAVLAVTGIMAIWERPEVIAAILPTHALAFIAHSPLRAFLLLGAVVLVVTGAEALYADMGHFNRRSIISAWFRVVMPALLLNYLGQGALLLGDPGALDNPFFRLMPVWAVLPGVVLAAIATVIASQAVISGAYSIARQAIVLRFWPRMLVCHTSAEGPGQIYMPTINWELLAAVLILVLGFRSSSNLASAYGLAVTGTMISTSIMVLVVARLAWKWSWTAVVLVGVPLLTVDTLFLSANLLKVHTGGWLPLLMAAILVLMMTTWRQGRRLLIQRQRHEVMALEDFVALHGQRRDRVPGTAIFLASIPEIVPPALLHNLHHNDALHERVILVAVKNDTRSHVRRDQRCSVEDLDYGFHRLQLRFGFMEKFDVQAAINDCCPHLLQDTPRVSYFIGRETIRATDYPGMALWRERLFVALSRNATDATSFFHLPPDRVVEIGIQVEI